MFDNYSNYKCHLDEPDDLASLADDLKVFEALEQEGEVERDDRQEVNHVHWSLGNYQFYWSHWKLHCIHFFANS